MLTYSLQSIPESKQGELLADALAFPLLSEVMSIDSISWPNPVIHHPPSKRDADDSQIKNRIKTLTDSVTPESFVGKPVIDTANWLPEYQNILEKNKEIKNQMERESMKPPGYKSSLERLLPLHTSGYLTPEESDELAKKIWGCQINQQTLPNTGLLPHALLLLPAPDTEQVKILVRRHLYEADTPLPAFMVYAGMAQAAANKTTRLFPTPEQALALFDRLVAWRPQIQQDDLLGVARSVRKQLTENIGNALSYAIAPALSDEAKTIERFEQLQVFYEEVEGAFFVIPALVFFAQINEGIAGTVEKIIRKALQSRDASEVNYAALALQKWTELPEGANSLQLNRLISRLIVIIESGRTVGLQQLLWVAGELFEKQRLNEEHVATLIEAVPNVFNAADYARIDPMSREAISASSIRVACVKLAKTLASQHPNASGLNALLKEAQTDALPEVRFAIGPMNFESCQPC
jgi:hypothetical protein